MRIRNTLLALVGALSLAAPAAAFAQDGYHGGDRGYAQSDERGQYDGRQDDRGQDDRGQFRGDERMGRGDRSCRRGVFYRRGSYCASHRRFDRERAYRNDRGYNDRYDDNRNDRGQGYSDPR